MLIYLASRYSRYQEMQAVRADLEKLGHVITSRWINGGHQISDDGLSAQAKEEERKRFATEDLYDLMQAECVVSFTEPPRSTNSRGGRHVEFGIALGRGMRVVVVGPRENVFHCLPAVDYYESYESCIDAFRRVAQENKESGATIQQQSHGASPSGNSYPSSAEVEAEDVLYAGL
jgi:hypothetical protein